MPTPVQEELVVVELAVFESAPAGDFCLDPMGVQRCETVKSKTCADGLVTFRQLPFGLSTRFAQSEIIVDRESEIRNMELERRVKKRPFGRVIAQCSPGSHYSVSVL